MKKKSSLRSEIETVESYRFTGEDETEIMSFFYHFTSNTWNQSNTEASCAQSAASKFIHLPLLFKAGDAVEL